MDQNRRDYADLDSPPPRRPDAAGVRRWLRPLLVPALALCIPAAFVAGFVAGSFNESYRQHHARFQRDRDAFANVLNSDPAFSRVWMYEYTGGGICVSGDVDSQAHLDRLRAEFVRMFGEAEAWRCRVSVRAAP